jgi:hypothetical protein
VQAAFNLPGRFLVLIYVRGCHLSAHSAAVRIRSIERKNPMNASGIETQNTVKKYTVALFLTN